jgi:hypothetical protein
MRQIFEYDRVDRLTDILFGVAAAQGLIGYGPLAHRVGMRPNHLSGLLRRVCEQSVEAGGPMWTALCVSAQSGQPLKSFYPLARALRTEYAELSDRQLWEHERHRCYDVAPAEEAVIAAANWLAK